MAPGRNFARYESEAVKFGWVDAHGPWVGALDGSALTATEAEAGERNTN
jgi:hypothetical protein